jgi:hypothetical protein
LSFAKFSQESADDGNFCLLTRQKALSIVSIPLSAGRVERVKKKSDTWSLASVFNPVPFAAHQHGPKDFQEPLG